MYTKRLIAAFIAISLLVVPVMAAGADDVYSVSPDTFLVEPVIYYTDNYVPGMLSDGMSTFANVCFGSFSSSGYTGHVIFQDSDMSNSHITELTSSDPVITVSGSGSYGFVSARYDYLCSVDDLYFGMFISNASSNAYFDFQTSLLSPDFSSGSFDTLVLNGDLTFRFSSQFSTNSLNQPVQCAPLDPIAVQLLVDGKPVGDIVDVSSYTSPFTSGYVTSVSSLPLVTIPFSDFNVYGITSAPELLGFRVYVDYAPVDNSVPMVSGESIAAVYLDNTFSFISLPSVSAVNNSPAFDYSSDLSSLYDLITNGLFNENNVPFLDVLSALLGDVYDVLSSNLAAIASSLTLPTGNSYLGSSGYSIVNSSGSISSVEVLRSGFLGLGSLSVLPSSSWYLSASGVPAGLSSDASFSSIMSYGFLGLRSLISGDEGYNNSYSGTITGNDNTEKSFTTSGLGPLLNHYMDAIQHDTGLLAYMFASPEDLKLKAEASNIGTSVSDSFFSGEAEGAKVDLNTVSGLKDVADGAGDMFDSGYGLTDLFTVFDDSDALSWFTAETAYALDSTTQVMSVNDDDPYNMNIYYKQLNAIALKRGEGNDG